MVWLLEGRRECSGGLGDSIPWLNVRSGARRGKEFESIGDTGRVGFGHENCVAPIVFQGGADIPGEGAMGGPGRPVGRLVVSDAFDARGCEGSFVEIELPE